MAHRLLVMRHAKSAYPEGVLDHDRPLGERGRRDAAAAGELLAERGWSPDLVLCSSAERTRETWTLAGARLAPPPVLLEQPDLYEAAPEDVLRLLRDVEAAVGTVLVVAHEPAVREVSALLAGPGSDAEALARMEAKFATAGIAVLAAEVPWAELVPGAATLEAFELPRG